MLLNLTLPASVDARSGEKKPIVADFKWSRQIMDLADNIMGLYQPDMYGIEENENGESMIGSMSS